MARRMSMARVHKVRRINRAWCVGYFYGSYWYVLDHVKTRSQANELADGYDDAICWGDALIA